MKTLKEPVSEPWVVHVYGQNRKLLWVLEPSHGWSFLLGLVFGVVLSVIHVNLARHSPESEPIPLEGSHDTPAFQVD